MGFDITGLGSIASLAKGIINKFVPDKMGSAEKAALQIQLQEVLQRRENAVIEAKKGVLIAELQQSDNYTKRARPTVVYGGLLFILLVHVILPIVAFMKGSPVPELSLPGEFWWTWGGICSVWSVGRTAEKGGMKNKAIELITGKK
jgi:hypothetical protein